VDDYFTFKLDLLLFLTFFDFDFKEATSLMPSTKKTRI